MVTELAAPWLIQFYASWAREAIRSDNWVLVLTFDNIVLEPERYIGLVMDHVGDDALPVEEIQRRISSIRKNPPRLIEDRPVEAPPWANNAVR